MASFTSTTPSLMGAESMHDSIFTTNVRPTARAQPKPRHGDATNLYVGSLHPTVNDAELAKRFSPFGRVVSAKVMLNIHTGESRGMGFVKFSEKESAVAALQALHRTTMHGQRVLVRFADARADFHPTAKTNRVFIRNLPLDISTAAVRGLLRPFGTVEECNLQLDSAGWKNGGSGVRTRMAFVTMATADEAEAAAAAIHATRPFPSCHATLMAKIADTENRRQNQQQPPHPSEKSTTAPASNDGSMPPSLAHSPATPVHTSDERPPSGTDSKGMRTSSSDSKTSSSENDEEPRRRPRQSLVGNAAQTPPTPPSISPTGSSTVSGRRTSGSTPPNTSNMFQPPQQQQPPAVASCPTAWAPHGGPNVTTTGPTAYPNFGGYPGFPLGFLHPAGQTAAPAMPPMPPMMPYMFPFPPATSAAGGGGFAAPHGAALGVTVGGGTALPSFPGHMFPPPLPHHGPAPPFSAAFSSPPPPPRQDAMPPPPFAWPTAFNANGMRFPQPSPTSLGGPR